MPTPTTRKATPERSRVPGSSTEGMTSMQHQPTGHVEVRHLARGDVYYAKGRTAAGTQFRKRLGKAWGKRSQPPAGYLTRSQAERRLEAILAGDDAQVNIATGGATFGEACAERLKFLEFEKQRKASTLADYGSVIQNDLLPHFGASTPVADITTLDIENFKSHLLARGLTNRTAQKVLVILPGILGRAKRKGWIERNPAIDAEKLTVRRSEEFRYLTPDEVERVALAADGDFGQMIRVAAYTGLRMGELLALRWRDVDFVGARLHAVRNYVQGAEDSPKSHKRRSVPLSDPAARSLDALSRRKIATGPSDLVFISEAAERLSDDVVRRRFAKALKAAGIPPMRFHDLRHTFGTLAASRGIELVRIQNWMGHADITTTMIYAHYAPAHDDAARLTAAFGGSHALAEVTESLQA
jgi:integrase